MKIAPRNQQIKPWEELIRREMSHYAEFDVKRKGQTLLEGIDTCFMRGSTLFYTYLSILKSMLEIIQANKRHLPILKNLSIKLPEQKSCKDSTLLYLACTVLRKYSLIAVEGGEAKGFLLALQATEHNYLWLHQLMVEPGIYERSLSRKLLSHLEDLLKSAWNTPVKSIKVALQEDQVMEREFFEHLKYKFTRNDEALGKEIFQKRVVL